MTTTRKSYPRTSIVCSTSKFAVTCANASVFVRSFPLVAALIVGTSANAGNLYWDINGNSPGAGGSTPAGTWDGTTANWSASSAGTVATVNWISGENAIFSAGSDASGTFALTLDGIQPAGGVIVEEGLLTLSSGELSLASGANVGVASGRSLTLSSVLSGSDWAKSGSGPLTLTEANLFTGPLTLSSGQVRFDHDQAAGTGSIVISPTGDVFLQNSVAATTLINALTVNNGNNFDISATAAGGTLTLNGVIDGNRSLWTVGGQAANTVVFGGINTFNGNVKISGGTLIVTQDQALGNAGGTTEVASGATLGIQGNIDYNTAETVKVSGVGVGGNGAVRNVSGVNSFFGVLQLLADATVGADAGTLDLAGTLTGATYDLTKVGTGQVTISGLGNSFDETFITAGVLQVDSELGAGAVDVSNGATLAGSGVAQGAVTLNGAIAPGSSPGVISTGPQTWNGGASYDWELSGAIYNEWDYVDITGALTINATPANKFTLKLTTLNPFSNLPGEAGDFDNTLDYDFLIAGTTTGIIGFDPDAFILNTVNFQNDIGLGAFVVDVNLSGGLLLKFIHPPFIVTQPTSITKECSVENATFAVVADGTATLSYQWASNGVALADAGRISGATTDTLTISPAKLGDDANYTCTIVNAYGSATTAAAALTVVDTIAPIITCPANILVNDPEDDGESVTFAATATDDCDSSPIITYSPKNPGDTFTGVTLVTATASDGYNTSQCTFKVIVCGPSQPVVYVDDDYDGLADGSEVVWPDATGTGPHYIGCDAFATVQDAINRVDAAGTVNVAAGTYLENVVANKTVTLSGTPGAILDGGGSGTVVSITANGVTLEGFTVQNSGNAGTDAGVKLDSVNGCHVDSNTVVGNDNGIVVVTATSNFLTGNAVNNNTYYGIAVVAGTGNTIESNTIADNGLDAIALDNASAGGGPVTMGSTGNFIKGNSLSSNRDGVFLGENCDNNQVTDGNQISSSVGIGVSCWRSDGQTITDNVINTGSTGIRLLGSSNNTITGNELTGNTEALKVDASWQVGIWYQSADNVISDNSISGNTAAVACGVEQTDVVNASGNWWGSTDETTILAGTSGPVDFTPYLDDGTDSQPGTTGFQGDFSTLHATLLGNQSGAIGRIQEAIDLVSGSTVVVEDGLFTESILISQSLTLESANGAASTTLTGTSATTITVGADDVTIRGLTVSNPSGKAGILATDQSGLLITENVVTDIGSSDVAG